VGLEAVDLYRLSVEAQAVLLVGHKVLDVLALVALELDHLAHFRVGDDGAIAGKLLLDDLEDLLLVELLRQALDRRQRLATIALCWWCGCQRMVTCAGQGRGLGDQRWMRMWM
jgi:hypothetical protein